MVCSLDESLSVQTDIPDTDINIPLFIRGPGIPENQVFDAVTSHTDLAPTFLSLAGTTTEGLDGKAIPLTKEEDLDASTEHVGVEYWGIVSLNIINLRKTKELMRTESPRRNQWIPQDHSQRHQIQRRRLSQQHLQRSTHRQRKLQSLLLCLVYE